MKYLRFIEMLKYMDLEKSKFVLKTQFHYRGQFKYSVLANNGYIAFIISERKQLFKYSTSTILFYRGKSKYTSNTSAMDPTITGKRNSVFATNSDFRRGDLGLVFGYLHCRTTYIKCFNREAA